MKAKNWIILYSSFVSICLSIIIFENISVDPYMHYRKPKTDKYYYQLSSSQERYLNNGIVKHFDYDALIAGSSMTENYKTSELDSLFGVNSIKVPLQGASVKELHNQAETALKYNPRLKYVFQNIDLNRLYNNQINYGTYDSPEYLYDDNAFNDYRYVLSENAFWNGVVNGKIKLIRGDKPGITSFDEYANWSKECSYGVNSLFNNLEVDLSVSGEPQHISEAEITFVTENVCQDLTSLPVDYPDVTFYYCFSPYSAAWWQEKNESGEIYKFIEAQKIVIEELLKHENIKVFSYFNIIEMTSDLNNYKDKTHYGEWINSLLLQWMAEGRGLLTLDNYEEYLAEELEIYRNFDYTSLLNQVDYKDDYIAASVSY